MQWKFIVFCLVSVETEKHISKVIWTIRGLCLRACAWRWRGWRSPPSTAWWCSSKRAEEYIASWRSRRSLCPIRSTPACTSSIPACSAGYRWRSLTCSRIGTLQRLCLIYNNHYITYVHVYRTCWCFLVLTFYYVFMILCAAETHIHRERDIPCHGRGGTPVCHGAAG